MRLFQSVDEVLIYVAHDRAPTPLVELLSWATGKPRWILKHGANDSWRPRIAVVFAAKDEDFQKVLNESLVHSLDCEDAIFQTYPATEDFSWAEREYQHERLLQRRSEYDAAIMVVPTFGNTYTDQQYRFADKFKRPVVFVDQNQPQGKAKPPNAVFVSVSDAAGGRCAGRAILGALRDEVAEAGFMLTGHVKQARVDSAIEVIEDRLPLCEIVVNDQARLEEGKAAQITWDFVWRRLKSGKSIPDFIYATTNAMARGVVESMEELTQRFDFKKPVIIGYDGISDDALPGCQVPVVDAVVQDPDELADAAVETAIDLVLRPGSVQREIKVKPSLASEGMRSLRRNKVSRDLADAVNGTIHGFGTILGGHDRRDKELLLADLNRTLSMYLRLLRTNGRGDEISS